MNRLPHHKRKQILHMLVEGSSIRSTARVVGAAVNTVVKLMLDTGEVASSYHDLHVRNLTPTRVECDEIWSFCYAKDRNINEAISPPRGAGSIWTWTAIDPDSKLFISWLVGTRDVTAAMKFMNDLEARLTNRVQLTTDGFLNYIPAIEATFGDSVDYSQLIKSYDKEKALLQKTTIKGDPDPKFISTSIVERQNLTMRMSMRRYTRKSNGFSKRVRNHCASLALYVLYYNFCRPHLSLRNPYPRTPAMAAGAGHSHT